MKDFLNHYELFEREVNSHDKIILEKRMLLIAEDAKKFLCNKENEKRTYEFTCDFNGLDIDLSEKSPFKISLTKKQLDIALEIFLIINLISMYNNPSKVLLIKTLDDNNLSQVILTASI